MIKMLAKTCKLRKMWKFVNRNRVETIVKSTQKIQDSTMFVLNHHYHHCPPYSELITTWVNEPKPNNQYKQSVSIYWYNGFTPHSHPAYMANSLLWPLILIDSQKILSQWLSYGISRAPQSVLKPTTILRL